MSKKFILFDENGVMAARLMESVNVIPDQAVEVTEAIWLATGEETDGIWSRNASGKISKSLYADRAPDYTALIANTRYVHEVSGTIIGGVHVFTDRDTQSKLTAAALRASRNIAYSVDWKTLDGTFVNLTSDQIIALADGVGDYVQACYTREAMLLAELADGAFTEAMLSEGWP